MIEIDERECFDCEGEGETICIRTDTLHPANGCYFPASREFMYEDEPGFEILDREPICSSCKGQGVIKHF